MLPLNLQNQIGACQYFEELLPTVVFAPEVSDLLRFVFRFSFDQIHAAIIFDLPLFWPYRPKQKARNLST